MRKEEYLQQLERLLYDIPGEDREEALQFYSDYLEDAGVDAEKVLTALGTPEELARSIRQDLYGDNIDGDFTRTNRDLPGTYRVPFSKGSSGGRFSGNSERNGTEGSHRKVDEKTGYYEYQREKKPKNRKGKLTTGQWILFFILLFCAAPVIIPICGSVIGILICIVAVVLALAFGVGIAGIALVITAIVLVIVALFKLIATPLSALIMLGGGLLSAGLGLLGIAITVWIAFKILPAVFKGLVRIFYGIIHR